MRSIMLRCILNGEIYNVEIYNVERYNDEIYNVEMYNYEIYNVEIYNVERHNNEMHNVEMYNHENYDVQMSAVFQEELAFMYEMLGLFEDALIQYDELDALFTQYILYFAAGSKQFVYVQCNCFV